MYGSSVLYSTPACISWQATPRFRTVRAAELAKRMPTKAAQGLVEWGPSINAEQAFATVLDAEFPVENMG
jgi:hypothetical protein